MNWNSNLTYPIDFCCEDKPCSIQTIHWGKGVKYYSKQGKKEIQMKNILVYYFSLFFEINCIGDKT